MANVTDSVDFDKVFGAAGFLAIGLPTGVCNLVIAASILKYSALADQKEFVILMGLALADGINLVCYAAAGLYRLSMILGGYESHLLTSIECLRLPHLWLWSFALPLSNQMLVAVSFDRLLLVSLREKYISCLGLKYAWGVVGGLFAFNMGFGLLAIALALTSGHTRPTLDPMCYHPSVYGSDNLVSLVFEKFSKYGESLFPLLSVIVFACVCPMYVYRRNRVSHVANANTQQRRKFQQKLTRSIAVSCLSTFLLACIPGRLGYEFLDMDMMLLSHICWLLIITNPLINVFIYHVAHRDMRTAMHGLLSCKILPTNVDLWPGNANHARTVAKRRSRRQNRTQNRYVEKIG